MKSPKRVKKEIGRAEESELFRVAKLMEHWPLPRCRQVLDGLLIDKSMTRNSRDDMDLEQLRYHRPHDAQLLADILRRHHVNSPIRRKVRHFAALSKLVWAYERSHLPAQLHRSHSARATVPGPQCQGHRPPKPTLNCNHYGKKER